jgi:hypothetical protein
MAKDFPAEKYSYPPVDDVRSCAEIILHLASGNIFASKAGKGEQVNWDERVVTEHGAEHYGATGGLLPDEQDGAARVASEELNGVKCSRVHQNSSAFFRPDGVVATAPGEMGRTDRR